MVSRSIPIVPCAGAVTQSQGKHRTEATEVTEGGLGGWPKFSLQLRGRLGEDWLSRGKHRTRPDC
jgi:hypothetical protein